MPSFIDNMTLIAVTYFTSIIAGDFRCIRESEIQAKETESKIEYEKEKNFRDLEKRVQEIYDKQNDSDKQKDYKKGSKQPTKKPTHPHKYSQGKAGNATPGGGNAASGGGNATPGGGNAASGGGNAASGSGNAASGGGSQISST
jgi:hypothetical protein